MGGRVEDVRTRKKKTVLVTRIGLANPFPIQSWGMLNHIAVHAER